ncbi:ribosome recycling factor [bacterium]|nr:ribosome recycling factor [bacterium]
MQILNNLRQELEKVVEFFKKELQRIRTGLATPVLVEDVIVEYYGSKVPLKQIAAISCPEPRQIMIQPWDKNSVEDIVRALSQENLGASPIVDKEIIRINLPPLTEEFRQTLIAQVAKKKEEAREAIRKWRDEFLKDLQKMFQNKEISEDEKFRTKDEIEKIVEEYNKKLDELEEKKKKEILE